MENRTGFAAVALNLILKFIFIASKKYKEPTQSVKRMCAAYSLVT